MACMLIDEYERNLRKYLQHKHQFSVKSERDRKNRVKKFLQFCCRLGIKDIRNIVQADYDRFMQYLSEIGYSIETRRKYALTLKEFFTRGKLPIKTNPKRLVKNAKLKKFEKLKQILSCCNCIDEHKSEILKIL